MARSFVRRNFTYLLYLITDPLLGSVVTLLTVKHFSADKRM
jgi:hypothetical protein